MFSVIDSVEELVALEDEWRALWLRAPGATIFQGPDWLIPWLRHVYRGGRIRSLAAFHQGRLVGLAPLFLWGAEGDQTLSFIGSGITDYNDALLEEGLELPSLSGPWRVCLEELRGCSKLIGAGAREICSMCPVIELPSSYDELLGRVNAKFRTDLRRAGNRVRKAGALRIERTASLDALLRLHSARWRSAEESGVLGSSGLAAFHRDVAERFERTGLLRNYVMSLDGRAIGAVYAFQHGGRVYGYAQGFDPEFGKLSPGAVLVGHAIEQAIQEGAREFDFLRGRESYKYTWTARDTETYRVTWAAGE